MSLLRKYRYFMQNISRFKKILFNLILYLTSVESNELIQKWSVEPLGPGLIRTHIIIVFVIIVAGTKMREPKRKFRSWISDSQSKSHLVTDVFEENRRRRTCDFERWCSMTCISWDGISRQGTPRHTYIRSNFTNCMNA